MKPITLALLGSVAAFVAIPGAAHAQTAGQMTSQLNCEPEPATSTPAVSTGGGIATGGGTSTGGGTGPGTGGTPVFGPSNPVVQPLPTPTPGATPTPSPTPVVTTPGTGGSVGNDPGYVTNGRVSSMRVTSSMHGTTKVLYSRATGVSSANQQTLSTVKTYPEPSGGGVVRTIGGQKILAKDANVALSGLDSHIVAIIDEINLTAAALGLPDPVITAGHDQAGHSPNSDHYTGDALDLRCNPGYASGDSCKKWVIALANALGSGYDAVFEDWHGANSHVHVAWTR